MHTDRPGRRSDTSANQDLERRWYEATPSMLHLIDMEGRLLMVSNLWLTTLGYTRDEIIGRRITDFLTAESHQYSDLIVFPAFLESGHCEDISYRMACKDGSVLDVLISAILQKDDAGHPFRILAAMTDVTARLRAEKALASERQRHEGELIRSREFLDQTGRLAGIGGWQADLTTRTVEWSDETCRIHGVEVGHKPTFEEAISFYPAQVQSVVQSVVANASTDVNGWDLELPLTRADGSHTWVRAIGSVEISDGKPARLMGAFQDISTRVAEKLALERANERVTLATKSGGIGIWEWDLTPGPQLWDESTYRLYGMAFQEEQATYDLWKRRLHPDDIAQAEEALRVSFAGGKQYDVEYRVLWKDGSLHHLRASGLLTFDETGKPVRMVGANWEVTESRTLAAALSDQHELLSVTLQSIGDGVITTDASGRITWLNPVAERLTGWSSSEALGRKSTEVFRILNEATNEPAEDPVQDCLKFRSTVALADDTILRSRSGEEFGVEDSAAPILNRHRELLGVVLVFHDVTEQRRLSGEMTHRASHDALTGLINRAEFEVRLRQVLHNTRSDHSHTVLLYLDLDRFKIVNDTCGHAIGDLLLVQVSKLFATVLRASDTLARLGGDEFAAILSNCPLSQAKTLAQRICDQLEEFRFVHENQSFRIGASIGLVEIDDRWTTTAAILQAADISCYAAKDAGRNRVHEWSDTSEMLRARRGETKWASRIELALDRDRFVLFAQRIEPLRKNGAGIHAEVLVRMLDHEGLPIQPGAFFPSAERFHLVSRVDRWVVKQTILWIQSTASFESIDCLNINLSGQSIGDRAFHIWALDVLSSAGREICRRLCFEITETVAVTNLIDAADFIAKLRELGVRVALDDFGAGASWFGYLKKLKVDYLKIDGQFIRDLLTDPLDDAAVRCFADVAKLLGMKTVAEWVEDSAVLERLSLIGVDFAQGFLVGKPTPIDEL